jgi:Leucine-rich repeat (LRR) protein
MKCLISILSCLSFLSIMAQHSSLMVLDSISLMKAKTYTDLDSALKEPDKVYKLVLRKKKYKAFPKEILSLKNLQYLDLSKNNIKEIPEEIGDLSLLQYLSCSKCQLTKIPKSIGKLQHLYYLNLNQNDIDSIPDEIGQLKKLQVLDLWDNNLSYFPPTMSYLENLKKMDVRSILLNEQQQNYIQSLLPNTKIYFSPPCKCSW